MGARTWTEQDPEPKGVTAVVDSDGGLWVWSEDEWWAKQTVTVLPGGAVLGGSTCNEWEDLFDHLPAGSQLREATEDEADTLTINYETASTDGDR